MGNPNAQFWRWSFNRIISVENRTMTVAPTFTASFSDSPFLIGTVLVEQTEIHKLRLTQTAFDAQVPFLNVEFRINGVTWWTFAWANGDSPKEVDFSEVSSNSLGPFPPDPPLILDAGATIQFKITDGNRLNNTDRLGFKATLWGIKLPT